MGGVQEINKAIWRLWCENKDLPKDAKVPMLYPEFHKDTILFVGLNPSFVEAKVNKHLKASENYKCYKCKYLFDFTSCKTCKNADISTVSSEECRAARSLYKPYFGPIEQVVTDVFAPEVVPYDHVDIFMQRKTNFRKDLHTIFTDKPSGERGRYGRSLNPFWLAQLKLSLRLIKEANPNCVIFLNTIAGDIFAFNLGGKVKLHPRNYGSVAAHEMTIGGRRIPVKFFKQLSGGGTRTDEKAALIKDIKMLIQ